MYIKDSWLQIAPDVSKDVLYALYAFSVNADKSALARHPADRPRWFDFIIAAYNEEFLNATLVVRLLVDDGWEEEDALALATKYDSGFHLIKQYCDNL